MNVIKDFEDDAGNQIMEEHLLKTEELPESLLWTVSDMEIERTSNLTASGAGGIGNGSSERDRYVLFPTRVQVRGGQMNQEDVAALKYPERHFFTLPIPQVSRERTIYTVADDKGFLLVGSVDPVDPGVKQDRCKGQFFICSAITHQWFSLPVSPPKPFVVESVGFVTQLDESGRSLSSYRVAMIESTVENIVGTFVPDYVDIQVFSSETGEWASVRLQVGRPYMFYRWHRSVVLNNTVYWTDPINGGILAYDPYSNHHRVIEPPSRGYSTRGLVGDYSTCGVYQGRLKYFEKLKSMFNGSWKVLKIWELQEDNHWINLSTSSFLSFDQRDPDVLYLNMSLEPGVVSYNVRTQSTELLDPSSSIHRNLALVGDYKWFLLKLPASPILISPHLMSKRAEADEGMMIGTNPEIHP
ncbi:OLC1v1021675C1 [Oldenlandia corymbosa var. corymbosa]|uniref:OLC1v1021675C1 n=1 Tax=Oldenlandia corymbosa var. corymbosa TaxID=529605 RepID=A0AAV1BW72_OLDCO|nr:OLC1v1021675C1 [Oldenlandia corymbosa var. corymbosa]